MAPTGVEPTMPFKIGRGILLVVTALLALNHFVLIFALAEPVLFTGFAAFNLYSFVVVLVPLRRRERWAWFTSWVLPLALAGPALTDPKIALFYYVVSTICAGALLLTMRDVLGARSPEPDAPAVGAR